MENDTNNVVGLRGQEVQAPAANEYTVTFNDGTQKTLPGFLYITPDHVAIGEPDGTLNSIWPERSIAQVERVQVSA